MSDSDEEWMPKKVPGKRRSIAPNARRSSVAPKIVVSLYSDADSEKQAKDTKSSKRLSILPKSTSDFKSDSNVDYNNPCHLLSTANSVNTRKSIAPKISNCASNSEFIHVETSTKHLQRRKSIAPGAISNTENEGNAKPTHKRMSIISKPNLNKYTDELKENEPFHKTNSDTNLKSNLDQHNVISSDQSSNNKGKDQTSQKRKSIAPKTASNAVKTLTQNEEKHPSQKRKSVAFKGVPVHPLQDERDKFEKDIKSYSGEDPLSVWYKYFKWVEQNFLKGGKDGQIVPLMQRCLRALDGQKQYYNDKRFIEIWLKFATQAQNPAKVYNHMFDRKIGCNFARLFIDWSSLLELEGNLSEANEILKKGVDCQENPTELKSYWSKFIARTTPNVMSDSTGSKQPQPTNSQKVTEPKITKRLGFQPMVKDMAPNVKSDSTGLSKPTPKNSQLVTEPKVTKLLKVQPMVKDVPPNVKSDSSGLNKPTPKISHLVTEPKKTKLHDVQPMPKDMPPKCLDVGDTYANTVSSQRDSCFANEHFRYYRQSCYMNPRMSVLPIESKIPEEQEENDPPVALFEPPDPMKIPMYDKNKIYAWSGEVSFEEIRAADWFKREKTISLELKVSEQKSIITEQALKIKLLEEQIEKLQMCLKINPPQQSTENLTSKASQIPAKSAAAPDTNSQHSSDVPNVNSKDENHVIETENNCEDVIVQKNLDGKDVASSSNPVPETGNSICVDPFDSKVNLKFLQSLNLPHDYYGSFFTSKERISLDLKKKDLIRVGDASYLIEDMISEGSYGKVFVATVQASNPSASKSKIALKVSKHASNWEIYMCVTLHFRLEKLKETPDVQSSVMKVTSAHKYANAIIFTNELSHKGTLLDLVNSYKIKKSHVPELLSMYITWELLQIVSKMHKCQIIHADIKPDNVLIRDNVSIRDIVDSLSTNTALVKLIDFGRAIDLTFFEKGVCFSSAFKKDKCVEMIQKKPWVFQIDWFGLLNCVHVLLFAEYMKVRLQANGRWFIEKKLPRRWDLTIWTPLFDELLNITACYHEPNIDSHSNRIMSKLQQNIKDLKF